jgi:hypothetical protein
MRNVEKFLQLNKFEKGKLGHENEYSNANGKIIIHEDHYEVIMLDTGSMYSNDLNIYWLIGVLTYYEIMPQFYLKA